MEKVIVFISKRNDIKKTFISLKKFKKNNIIFIALTNEAKNELEKNKIRCKSIEDYVSQRIYILTNKIAKDLTNEWSNIKLNGLKLNDILTYENISLWEMSKWEILTYLLNVVKNIEIIKTIIKNENPNKIIIPGKNNLIEKSIIAVSNSEKIPILSLNPIQKKIFSSIILKQILINQFYQIRAIERKYSFQIKNIFSKNHDVKQKNNILFFVSTRNQIFAMVPVIRELQKNKKNKITVIKFGGIITNFQVNKVLKKNKIPFKTFEGYMTSDASKRAKNAIDDLMQKWMKLKKNPKFLKSFKYNDIYLWNLVEDLFQSLFETREFFPQIIKFIELTKCVIKKEKPNIVIVTNIIGSFGKTVVSVANLKNIPNVYIQHFTTSTHPGYEAINSFRAFIPGEYDKRVYIKLGTDPKKLIVTGQPKYDLIPSIVKNFDRKKFCRKLNLDPKKGIFVLTTQPLSREENQQVVNAALDSIKKLPDKQLVIKLHPREVNKIFYQNLVNQTKAKNVLVTKDVDTFELLNSCELMMTISSITALEAMIFNKPVIILNLWDKPEMYPFVEYGAALEVRKQEELLPTINRIFEDNKLKKELEKNRKIFISHFDYRVDGRSSKRIRNLIENIIEKKIK